MQLLRIIMIFFALSGLFACDNSSSAGQGAGSGSIDAALFPIIMGGLDENSGLYVKIPIELFGGSEDDLEGAEVDLYMNGALIKGNIIVTNLYSSSERRVRFYLSPVALGSTLSFLITDAVGGETYFVGTVESDESFANLSLVTPSLGATYDIAEFFDEKLSTQGDATGSDLTGTYTVTYGDLSYSESCDEDFMAETQFYTSGEKEDEFVTVSQQDGSFAWDDVDGVIYSDGSFEIFDGEYVDENNYTYVLYQGSVSDDGGFSGTFFETIVLDGTSLTNGFVGSCSVSTSFSGKISG